MNITVCNSHYRVPQAKPGSPPQYVKQGSAPSVPLLTLQRCTMKNAKDHWWFISYADEFQPGTDRDVDYYLHRSTAEHAKAPPAVGWDFYDQGMAIKGAPPAPRLIAKGSMIPAGRVRSSYFDIQLVHQCIEKKLHELPFILSSIHREVISRSGKLMTYLIEYYLSLSTNGDDDDESESVGVGESEIDRVQDLLHTMWSAAITSTDSDIYEEIFALLVSLSPSLGEKNFETLMSLAMSSITLSPSPNTASSLAPYIPTSSASVTANVQRIAILLEKYSASNYQSVLSLSDAMVSSLISLAWSISSSLSPSTTNTGASVSATVSPSHSKTAVIVQDLLSFCFKQPGGRGLVLEKIQEATKQLLTIAERASLSLSRSPSSTLLSTDSLSSSLASLSLLSSDNESEKDTVSVKESVNVERETEDAINSVLQTLLFLFVKTDASQLLLSASSTSFDALVATNVDVGLKGEIVRYMHSVHRGRHRGDASHHVSVHTYKAGLQKRFEILRKYLVTVCASDLSLILDLWSLISSHHHYTGVTPSTTSELYIVEIEEFLNFLKGGERGGGGTGVSDRFDAIVNETHTVTVFTDILCSKRLPWDSLTTIESQRQCLDCFRKYFLLVSESLSLPVTVGGEGDSGKDPLSLGLETLWSIALSITALPAAQEAIDLLLRAYETMTYKDSNATVNMLEVIFHKLKTIESSLSQSTSTNVESNGIDDEEKEKSYRLAIRCVMIIQHAIRKFESLSSNSNTLFTYSSAYTANLLSHSARGRMYRFPLTVHYKRRTMYYNHRTMSDNWQIEKGSEGSIRLEVHPCHTIQQLRSKLLDSLDLGSSITMTIDSHCIRGFNANEITNSTRLYEIGYTGGLSESSAEKEGAEIAVTYQTSYSSGSMYNGIGMNSGASRYTGGSMVGPYSTNNSMLNTSTGSANVYGVDNDDLYRANDSEVDLLNTTGLSMQSGGGEKERERGYSQQLVDDIEKFDCLLTLTQLSSLSPSVTLSSTSSLSEVSRSVWTLLMSLPSQSELVNFVETCIRDIDETFWTSILEESPLARTTYLLQILDSLLQPAPECVVSNNNKGMRGTTMYGIDMDIDNSQINDRDDDGNENEGETVSFRDCVMQSGGLQACVKILLATPSADNLLTSSCFAVALHIIGYLLYPTAPASVAANTAAVAPIGPAVAPVDASTFAASFNVSTFEAPPTVPRAPSAPPIDLTAMLSSTQEATHLLEKLLYFARLSASRGDSTSVSSALEVIKLLIKSPHVAAQFTNADYSKAFLLSVLKSSSRKVRESACNFAIQVGRSSSGGNKVLDWLIDELDQLSVYSDNNEPVGETLYALTTLLLDIDEEKKSEGYQENVKDARTERLAHVISSKLEGICAHNRSTIVSSSTTLTDSAASSGSTSGGTGKEPAILTGLLQLLVNLINLDIQAVQSTPFGQHLVTTMMSDFLFNLNDEMNGGLSLCTLPSSREAGFHVLHAYACQSRHAFDEVLDSLSRLTKSASKQMRYSWGLQVSYDVRNHDLHFAGLKNQGCTCYMNSLLQLLFMSNHFREAILKTPIRESHRTTLWHRDGVDLVGKEVMFEWTNGSWRVGKVIGYDPDSDQHRIEYSAANGKGVEEHVTLNIHEGRFQRETGRVKLVPSNEELDNVPENVPPLTEQDAAAYAVLEQLQRTFCFLKHSKKRYFDPRPLVDACKTLNLNFNVYHQNDASEFCDQLLDRIETATRGKHTSIDMWNHVFCSQVFGGSWLTQKIPRDCDSYSKDKTSCGHWQGSRKESFLKVELMIRGKESIDESLRELVQGELMDGENKIHCDVCDQKKATIRRTSFSSLPTTLILHLKRFDLDFQTFETVKLNNRMEFPLTINMLQYTKEGLDLASEGEGGGEGTEGAGTKKDKDGESKELRLEDDEGMRLGGIDPMDYEYELQGVLVHAGVAQGGHYYSFIKDTSSFSLSSSNPNAPTSSTDSSSSTNTENWYKFDDDEVTPFTSDQIPLQCYGGSSAYASGVYQASQQLEDDRTSNALVLFYSKVKTSKSPIKCPTVSTNSSVTNNKGEGESKSIQSTVSELLVDGENAFLREVRRSNLQHLQTVYLIDPELNTFLRALLASIIPQPNGDSSSVRAVSWNVSDVSKGDDEDIPLRTVQYALSFLLDVSLHCRERAAVRNTVLTLKDVFHAHPHTAAWFVRHVITTNTCTWFSDYLVTCTDPLARATFVQVLVYAACTIAPGHDTSAVEKMRSLPGVELRDRALSPLPSPTADEKEREKHYSAICAVLVRIILEYVFKCVNHLRVSDELFVLIRDLSTLSPTLSNAFRGLGFVGFLSYLLMPEHVTQTTAMLFERHLPTGTGSAGTGGGRGGTGGGGVNLAVKHQEYTILHQSVFEAIASLLGIPQVRKVPLVIERERGNASAWSWDSELTPEAKDALTVIFTESNASHSPIGVMDQVDVTKYFEKVLSQSSSNTKVTNAMVKGMLEKGGIGETKVTLDTFLKYHEDIATYNPKQVWRVS